MDAAPEVEAPRCASCYFVVRANAQFCAHCGAPQSSEAQAAHRERVPDLAQRLLVACVAFALPLGTSLAIMLAEVQSVAWLRLSEAACFVVGVGGMVALGPPARAGLQLPWNLSARGVALTIGVTFAALCAAALLTAVWPFTTDEGIVLLYTADGHGFGAAMFDFAVLAPIAEELAFRGVLLMALVPVLGDHGAVWTSALLFATLHLSPISFVHLVLLGVLFARLRLGTGSIYPGMLVHGIYNAIVTAYAWRGLT